ncbi:MAG TPA: L,D-transpeptidase family protein [bacterium]|nr:L,D-transpeptidase family protein [bacterium]
MRKFSRFGLIAILCLAAACATKQPPQRAKAPVGEPVPSVTGLEKALQDYQAIAAKGGWPQVSPNSQDKLQKGSSGPSVTALRQRLAVTGDLAKAGTSNVFDDDVEQGVMRFQERHGLEPDGSVGKETLAALNVTAEERIRQIRVNLAQRETMPKETAPRFVVVNIPDFRLRVIDHGKRVLGMKVVLGQKRQWQTPLLDSQIKYLVLNPRWNVPSGIFAKELIHDLRKDPTYLERHRMKAISTTDGGEVDPATIDWANVSATNPKMRIVQREGAGNSLGRIKFLFPNPYDVYLHDTPMKKLFARNMRALSHGCVRVENPLDLAELLMNDNPEWTREKIQKAIDSGRNRDIPLATPVPVHIIYRTAWVDEKGQVNFREDVYGRDAGMAAEVAPAGKSS